MKGTKAKRKHGGSPFLLSVDFAFYLCCAYVALSAAAIGREWWIAVILGLAMYASLSFVYYGLAHTFRLPKLRYKDSIAAGIAFLLLGIVS